MHYSLFLYFVPKWKVIGGITEIPVNFLFTEYDDEIRNTITNTITTNTITITKTITITNSITNS